MNAVIEAQASTETILEVRDGRGVLPASASIFEVTASPARVPLRHASPRWNTSLCEKDLQCLLQIIESDLIPQLLNSYSPAANAPDSWLATG